MPGMAIDLDDDFENRHRALHEDAVIDSVFEFARVSLQNVMAIQRIARTNDCPAARPAALSVLETIRERVDPPDRASARRPSPSPSTARRLTRVEDLLMRARQRLGRERVGTTVQRIWTCAGLAISVLAAACVADGRLVSAVALVSARVAVSVLLGPWNDLPFEGYSDDDRQSWVVGRVVSSHLGDAVVLLGVLWSLLGAHRSVYVMALAASVVLMLVSTLARTSALQVGTQIRRLTMERVIRTGGLLAGLVAASVFQPTAPTHGFPVLALAYVGSAVFAFLEMMRTHGWLRTKHRNPVSITVTTKEETAVLRPFPAEAERRTADHRIEHLALG